VDSISASSCAPFRRRRSCRRTAADERDSDLLSTRGRRRHVRTGRHVRHETQPRSTKGNTWGDRQAMTNSPYRQPKATAQSPGMQRLEAVVVRFRHGPQSILHGSLINAQRGGAGFKGERDSAPAMERLLHDVGRKRAVRIAYTTRLRLCNGVTPHANWAFRPLPARDPQTAKSGNQFNPLPS
jgi:hypothetical protein